MAFLSLFSIAWAKSESDWQTGNGWELTATAPTSFCKCTCAGNSTIIALDAPVASQKPTPDLNRKTCNDCNRQFCMGYSFCKGVKDEAVFTTCFRTCSRMKATELG